MQPFSYVEAEKNRRDLPFLEADTLQPVTDDNIKVLPQNIPVTRKES